MNKIALRKHCFIEENFEGSVPEYGRVLIPIKNLKELASMEVKIKKSPLQRARITLGVLALIMITG
ncbi:hypothetical protein J22TS3_42910 [Paenibacillus sp. J22TS3]|nr:hypothetical protein J22TS3_42910 [Paenibacillus sp. J22TS3]